MQKETSGESYLRLFAVGTKSEELKPVLGDLVSCFAGNGFNESLEIVAFEDCCFTALLAEEEMLVTGRGGDECLTSFGLVDALNQTLFFERFERAIDGDQAQGRMSPASFIVNFDGGDGMRAVRHDLHDSAARVSEAIALFVQLDKPRMFTHIDS
jgi:hypothetical protein